ncbi:MAG: amino acid permease [Bacteroidota bacterium]|nr:amino acid permease [Bacteroidota bacterium]MDP4251853.1 amino acid permease [Bacteroidota bacterium]
MKKDSKLGVFDCTMIVVSLVIGMGIFRTPVNVARAVPDTFLFFFTWVIGGVVALCGALTYAEIGSRLPVTGGYYKIFSYGYHPSIAFAINCIILISNAASLAGASLIGSEYISGVLFPHIQDAHILQNRQIAISILSILIFYGVNLLGLKMSSRAQNVLTVIKISLVILLISPLFFASASAPVIPAIRHLSPGWLAYLKGFGTGLIAVSFTYGGYQQTINFGADVSNPGKNIPRAIFLGISLIILLYLTVNYAYMKVIGLEGLRTSTGIASVMAAQVFGNVAGKVLSILLFLSVLAYVNVLLLSNPRVMYAMSVDGVIPAVFKKRLGPHGVLFSSLSAFTAVCVIVVFWAKAFDEVLSFTIFLDCFGMAASAGTIFILRKKKVQPPGSSIYRMKIYPLMPLIFISAYVYVAVSIFIDRPGTALTALGVLALFMIIYFAGAGIRKSGSPA